MAKAAWITTTPGTGNKNGSVAASATAHTGRVNRTSTLTFATTAGTPAVTKTVAVTQTAKAEFVTIDATKSATAAAGKVTITGTSNSAKLTFAWDGADVGATIPATFTANEATATNGTAITGDPGASAQYTFSIEIDIPINDTVVAVTRKLKVTAGESTTAVGTCTITQAAGAPRLAVSPTSITIPQAGTAQTVTVESNTTWSVS